MAATDTVIAPLSESTLKGTLAFSDTVNSISLLLAKSTSNADTFPTKVSGWEFSATVNSKTG